MPLVMKFSWADCTRTTEGTLIQRAIERAKGDKRVTDHMPYVVGEKIYAEYTTEGIRKALNIAPRTRRVQENGVDKERVIYRELRVITSERLEPLFQLCGQDFISAWFQCKEVHYLNWLNDIHHKDPSATNLMYRLRPDESIEAVLNDWDLGIDARELQTHLGFEVTGTIPFMAIDLLTPQAMRGEVRHLYRHDLEAMIWVFVWIMCCYDEGKQRTVPEEVAEWTAQDPKAARGGKRSFPDSFSQSVAAPSWAVEYPLANLLVDHMADSLRERAKAINVSRRTVGAQVQPDEPDESRKAWKEHWALVKSMCADDNSKLHYMKKLLPKYDY
ncbi:hypothetical protein BD626DRAFT_586521 [Schizophyllum amplum]|uniref:Fungal-type protein kinase domain-containing protein n=1 Tax=Schizophyllum amplum TaxID=97359 RepID=A0A550BYY0_9AGAR|nr:hypothetical protein BD626DRAFT_586521 [Auriculariopsis ampla]